MQENFELEPVDFLTVGTIGAPGQRVFHLQARSSGKLYTVIVEKEQVMALSSSIRSMLEEIEKQFSHNTPSVDTAKLDLNLLEPILPLFRVSSLGLGYDAITDRVIMILNELQLEDETDEPRLIRMVVTREQALILSVHTDSIVARGRPICGNCGRPIEPDGHFCPKSNGHKHH